MSFHHLRRLTEHWPDNTKKLSPSVKFVAATIASHLNDKTNTFSLSSKSLSKWTGGLHRNTVDSAIIQLAELGVFGVVRERQRKPRAFRLLVECPSGCERLRDHNTKLELSQLAKRESPSEETSALGLGNEFTQIGQVVPVDWATNRYQIETLNKKDDMKKSFEFLFITEILETLKATNQYTANHALLTKALLEIPELVEERAKAIQARAKHSPHSYLKSSIVDSPTSLIPKQETKTQEAAPAKFWTGLVIGKTTTGELEHHWNALKENQELVDWAELDREHVSFLAHLYKSHTPISNTAANLVSEAAERKILFSPYWYKEQDAIKPSTLTDLVRILKEKQDTNTLGL